MPSRASRASFGSSLVLLSSFSRPSLDLLSTFSASGGATHRKSPSRGEASQVLVRAHSPPSFPAALTQPPAHLIPLKRFLDSPGDSMVAVEVMEQPSPDEYEDHVASDADSFDDELDLDVKQEDTGFHSSPSASQLASGKIAPGVKGSSHMQKRRRVTRACDECRRKKIKCDGKQPCTHCTVYSYDCTYDQPSNRRRNPAPQYVENLEHRVHRAETLLHILIPNLDLSHPGIDAAVAQGWIPGAPGKGNPSAAQRPIIPIPTVAPNTRDGVANIRSDTNLESMVRAVAQMDLDEQGHWDYHGHSSGLSFVRRMREQLGDIMGPETTATPFTKTRPMSQLRVDSPKSSTDSSGGDHYFAASDLPPRALAREVCGCAITDAAALLRLVHQPSFWQSFNALYDIPPEQWSNDQHTFLPLFHSAMALGHLFGKDESSNLNREGYENAIQQGFAHFKMARQLMDIADCRDLTSIQAVIFMILFLQSSARLSQCYAYVGVALRSALRMGLHRAYTGKFDPIEAEIRKRVFWIVRKLDIYVGAMLGLPQTLSDDDIDQEFPSEVDDEYITRDGLLPQPEGQVSLMTAFNAHTRLVQILSKIVRQIYPIKGHDQHGSPDKSYSVPFSAIRGIESDLENWKNSLPPVLSPCPAPQKYTRIQQLLRLSYAHAQVMLYRPFLHFTAMEKRSKIVDQRAYACAASYVNVSRNIIHITTHMKQKGLLNGSFWFIMYTTFFSILSLVYFAAENPDNATTQAVIKDALEGRQVLASLAARSLAADRCTATLNFVFQKLPEWMQTGQQNPTMPRKRHWEEGSQMYMHHQGQPQASLSHPDVASTAPDMAPTPGLQRRAETFPRHGARAPTNGSPPPYPSSTWSQSGSSSMGPLTPTSNGFDGSFQPLGQHNAANNPVQQYPVPPNYANPALPDLSAMMFPTADEPFSYPNQPLTTFENNQQFAKNNPYVNTPPYGEGETSSSASVATPPSRGREDNLEAQFFTLPPYIEQRQQQQHQQQQRQQQHQQQQHFGVPNMNFSNGPPTSVPGSMSMPNGGWPSQPLTHALSPDLVNTNINIQDIFGGAEWNPMIMNPGFQNQ